MHNHLTFIFTAGGFNADNTMNSKTYLLHIDNIANIKTLHYGFENTDHHTFVLNDSSVDGEQNETNLSGEESESEHDVAVVNEFLCNLGKKCSNKEAT